MTPSSCQVFVVSLDNTRLLAYKDERGAASNSPACMGESEEERFKNIRFVYPNIKVSSFVSFEILPPLQLIPEVFSISQNALG